MRLATIVALVPMAGQSFAGTAVEAAAASQSISSDDAAAAREPSLKSDGTFRHPSGDPWLEAGNVASPRDRPRPTRDDDRIDVPFVTTPTSVPVPFPAAIPLFMPGVAVALYAVRRFRRTR